MLGATSRKRPKIARYNQLIPMIAMASGLTAVASWTVYAAPVSFNNSSSVHASSSLGVGVGGAAARTSTRVNAAGTAGGGAPTKRVLMIRHGQAEHNVYFEKGMKEEGRRIRDPSLTELGFQQAKNIKNDPIIQAVMAQAQASPNHNAKDNPLVIVSPLRRTLQTALHAFGEWRDAAMSNGQEPIAFVCNADIQETGEIDCDCGRPASQVKEEFAMYPYVDFTGLSDDWHLKQGDYKDRGHLLVKRFNRFTDFLLSRPEETVIVVAHHNIFLANLGISFKNCEVREYSVSAQQGWKPVQPLVSQHDGELTEEDKKHIGIYAPHAKTKMQQWGLPAPARFR